MASQCPMIMAGVPPSQLLEREFRLVVRLVGLMEMATVSLSVESIGSRIEWRPFVVFKGITNVRCLCGKKYPEQFKTRKRKCKWQPICRIILKCVSHMCLSVLSRLYLKYHLYDVTLKLRLDFVDMSNKCFLLLTSSRQLEIFLYLI